METLSKRYEKSDNDIQEDIEKSHNETAIHRLNNDCLLNIFKFLTITDRVKIERVCKRWETAIRESWQQVRKIDEDQKLWGFDMMEKSHAAQLVIIEQVLKRCGYYVTHIDFTKLRFNDSILYLIGEICSNLVSINFDYQNLESYYSSGIHSDSYLSELFMKNRNLKHFKLKNCKKLHFLRAGEMKVQGTYLLYLSEKSIQTIIINEEDLYAFPERIFEKIGCFKNLETLVLSHNDFISTEHKFVKSQLVTLPSRMKHLNIEKSLYDLYDLNSIIAMANLEELHVKGAEVTDEFLYRLTENCQKLSVLVMDGCPDITDSGVKELTKLPSLKVLSIAKTRISDQAIKNMWMLTDLNCSICINVEDDGICTLLESSDSIKNLNIKDCYSITKRTFDAFILACDRRSEDIKLASHFGVGEDSEEDDRHSYEGNVAPVLRYDFDDDYSDLDDYHCKLIRDRRAW